MVVRTAGNPGGTTEDGTTDDPLPNLRRTDVSLPRGSNHERMDVRKRGTSPDPIEGTDTMARIP